MSIYEFGPFHLDAEQLLLSAGGVPIALGPKVVETLLALVEHPGEVLSKAALLHRVWPEGFVEEANLAQNVYVLRKALHGYWDAEAIATVPRRGYRFLEPVTRHERRLAEPRLSAGLPSRPALRPGRMLAVAATLAVALSIALAGVASNAGNRPTGAPKLSAQGARLYAIGRYYWNQRTVSSLQKSLSYFAQVVDTDPRDARGYAALADANAMMDDYGYGSQKPIVYRRRARAYASKALAIDPNSAEAYAALGIIDIDGGTDSTHGMTDLRHAIALDSGYGPAHQWYGIALLGQGNVRQALDQLQTAADLDPLSVSTTAWLSSAAYYSHRYGEAIAYARQTLDMSPSRTDVLLSMGASYEALGQYAYAIDAYKTYGQKCPSCAPEVSALLARVYALQHHLPAAHAALASAQAHPKNVSPDDVAAAFAAIGEPTKAVAWLERLRGHYGHALLSLDPRLETLHDDAQFQRIAGVGANAT
ncbi:MAG TPA: winged helix-turn-helix domain-containing protein [Candidatus Baltobacteraceae bacterium]